MPQQYATIEDAAAAAVFRAIARNYREESGSSVVPNSDNTYSITEPENALAGTPEALRAAEFNVPQNAVAIAHNHPHYANIWEGASQADIIEANNRNGGIPNYIGIQDPTSQMPSNARLVRYTPGETTGERVGSQVLSRGDEVLAQFPIDEWQKYWDDRLGTNDAERIAADRAQVQQNIQNLTNPTPTAIINAAIPQVTTNRLPAPERGQAPTRITTRSEETPNQELGSMSHAELWLRRKGAPRDEQMLLAPFEHRAFAREFAQESPVLAALSVPFAAPLYQLYKAFGGGDSRTGVDLDQMWAGYHGLFEGLRSDPVNENRRINKVLSAHFNRK